MTRKIADFELRNDLKRLNTIVVPSGENCGSLSNLAPPALASVTR